MRNDGDALASTPEDAEVDAGDVVGEVVKQPKDAPSRDEPTSMGWLARYCRHCERNPWTGFLSVFFTVLVMAVVVGAFGLARFDTENDKEWVILEDEVTSRTDAAEAALKLRDRSIGKVAGAAILPREKESEGATLMFQFESTVDGVSVFNRESILLMKEISDMVLATPGYADVCQLAYDGEGENATSLGCVPPVSPLNYFFPTVTRHANGTVANVTHDGLGADLVTDIDAVVRSFDADRRGMGYFLDGGFDPQTLHNRMTRLKYPVGAPLKGFNDNSRDEEKQENKVGKLWLDAVEKALFERFGMSAGFLSSPYLGIPSERDVEVRWYAAYLRRRDSQLIINYDLAWAFASILSVWGYMAFSTGSVFIASLGMFEILMSLPVSIFIYKLVFRIAYLGNIQVLSIFIVLGIGADDVFVFYDAFKQSALVPHVKDNILDRVTYTAERASKAISVTSFTTMMAFLATAMSKVMPISAFGILSATMVFFLFVVNVAFFPPALMLYDRYVGKMCSCARLVGDKAANAEVPGSRPASADGSPTSTATLSNDAALNDTARVRIHAWESSEKTPTLTLAPTPTKAATGGGRVRRVTVNPFALRGSYAADRGDGSDDSSMDDAESGTKNFAMDKKRLRPVEWFYREPFFRFIKSPARHAILVAFVALLLYGAWGANKLEPPAQQEQWYPSDHMMQAFANKREAFASSDEDRVIVVDVFWGLDGMDVSSVNRWKPAERGELRLTQTFDASSPEAQTHLANACDELKAATCDAPGCEGGTLLRNGAAARVICPMRDFAKYQSALNRTFPAAKESFASEMYEFLSTKHGKFLRKHVGFEAANADFSLDDKVVVVTGASRGIGESIAVRLAQRGANVALLATSWTPNSTLPGTIGEAWERCRKVRKDEDCVIGVRCDITDPGQVDFALNQIVKKWGRVDVVINNASTHWPKTVAETDRRRYDKMMNVNVKGAFNVTTACMPWLRLAHNAHVLTIAPAPLPDNAWLEPHACYTASKVGMSLLSIALEARWRDAGVAFNTLWPRHAVATAATSFIGGDRLVRASRTPAIVADAAFRIVVSPANFLSGRAFSDRDVLRSCGITDFAPYNVDPDLSHEPVSDFFVAQASPSPEFANPAEFARFPDDEKEEGDSDEPTKRRNGVILVLCDEDCDFARPVCAALLRDGHRVVLLAHVRDDVNDLHARRAFNDDAIRRAIASSAAAQSDPAASSKTAQSDPAMSRRVDPLRNVAVKHADLSDADALASLVQECVGKFFAVDAVVNLLYTEVNTGYVPGHADHRPGRVYGEPIDEELDVKLRASFLLIGAALAHVAKSGNGPRRIVCRCAPPSHADVPADHDGGAIDDYLGDVVNDVREALQGYHVLGFASEFASATPNPVAVNGLCFDASDAVPPRTVQFGLFGSVRTVCSVREKKIGEFADAVAALLAMTPAERDEHEGKEERAGRIARGTFWRVRDVLAAYRSEFETKSSDETRSETKAPFDGAPDRANVRRDYTPRDYVFPENDRDLMHLITRYEHPAHNMTKQSVKESGWKALIRDEGPPEPPGWVVPRDPNPSVWVTGEKLPDALDVLR